MINKHNASARSLLDFRAFITVLRESAQGLSVRPLFFLRLEQLNYLFSLN